VKLPAKETGRQPDPSQRRHREAWFVGLVCRLELGYAAAVEAILTMVLNFLGGVGLLPAPFAFLGRSSQRLLLGQSLGRRFLLRRRCRPRRFAWALIRRRLVTGPEGFECGVCHR